MGNNKAREVFVPLNIAVVTVSDTRTEENDTSGRYLQDALMQAGHRLAEKHICKDDIYRLRALVANLVADKGIQAIITTGGNRFYPTR